MNLTTSKSIRNRTALAFGGLTAALLSASLAASGTPQPVNASRPTIVGTWFVQVTLRNCTTNAPTGAPFNSLVTYNRGGTVAESTASTAFAPNQRTDGHGAWTGVGASAYSQRMIALIRYDTPANLPGTPGFDPAAPVSPGFFAGWQTVTHTVRLDDDGRAVSAGTNEFHKADGTVYRTGCSTAIGQRFE